MQSFPFEQKSKVIKVLHTRQRFKWWIEAPNKSRNYFHLIGYPLKFLIESIDHFTASYV